MRNKGKKIITWHCFFLACLVSLDSSVSCLQELVDKKKGAKGLNKAMLLPRKLEESTNASLVSLT
jgi:hypothetical protein